LIDHDQHPAAYARYGLCVPGGKLFMLNFSGFLYGNAVQEHHHDEFAALEKRFLVPESTAQNGKPLTMGSIPAVASKNQRFTGVSR
jgi:hypothetical protein